MSTMTLNQNVCRAKQLELVIQNKREYIGFIVTHMVPRDALPIDGVAVYNLSRDIYNALHYENWLGYVPAS